MLKIIDRQVPQIPSVSDFQHRIEFQNVSVTLGDFHFPCFTHTFEKGKKYAIIGPSGTGKTTIFNLLMQYVNPDEGSILIDGKPIEGKDTSKIMTCINQFEHIFHTSFTENATVFHTYPQSRMKQALQYFDNQKVNSLTEKQNAQELSGGENQMMQLIRAVTADKPIILMDESFSAVDENNKTILREKLLSLDKTILYITHDVSEDCLGLFDEVIELKK